MTRLSIKVLTASLDELAKQKLVKWIDVLHIVMLLPTLCAPRKRRQFIFQKEDAKCQEINAIYDFAAQLFSFRTI